MAKFNAKGSLVDKTKTVNKEGGAAFSESPKVEFISTLLTTFLKDKFYESQGETMRRLINLMNDIDDKKFLGKAAIYARTKFGMRSVSHFVAGEIAKNIKGEEWTKNFFDKIVYRPDDMLEILAYYFNEVKADTKGKRRQPPASVRKGFRKAIGKFNAYDLGKYRGESKTIGMVDLVNMIHPTPTETNGFAIGDLVNGTLKSKDTWETNLTQAGQKAVDVEDKMRKKAEVWVDLVGSKKIGYFALLRNLRNILEQAPMMVDKAIEMLTEEKLIKKSLVLPFRYATAYKEIQQVTFEGSAKVLKAISRAADIALKNVPTFPGKNLIVLDGSGSMNGKPLDIGSLFSAVLLKANENADFMAFANEAKYMTFNSDDSVLSLSEKISEQSHDCGGGTNFHSIFQTINKQYDRIIILSDMQGWMESSYGFSDGGAPTKTFAAYKTKYNTNPYVYSFNLNDYGTIQFPEKNVFCMAGWSEKVFDVMSILESDKNALVNEVEKIQL